MQNHRHTGLWTDWKKVEFKNIIGKPLCTHPFAFSYFPTSQSLSSSVLTKVLFTEWVFKGIVLVAGNGFRIFVSGLYEISFNISFDSQTVSVSNSHCEVLKNEADVVLEMDVAVSGATLNKTITNVYLEAWDELTVRCKIVWTGNITCGKWNTNFSLIKT